MIKQMIVLIGPPASGKSTYRNQLVEQGWSYVNNDEVREANPEWSERQVLQFVEFLATSYMRDNKNIVIDNTNLNPRTVARWLALGRSFDYQIDIKKFFDVPWKEAVLRDSLRPKPVGKSVVMQMYMDADIFVDTPREVVIFDLDGTICNIEHRRHFVQDGKKDWKSFNAGICNDVPNKAVVQLYELVAQKYDIIFMSGRNSDQRKVTEGWLSEHGLWYYHMLIMRGYKDSRADWIVKKELYEKYVKPYYSVQFVVDDRDQVVKMWRDEGLTCFQCDYGDF